MSALSPTSFEPVTTINNTYTKYTNMKIGSLNCRSLSKPSKISTSQDFTRFLRTNLFDILCLQETHAGSTEIQSRLTMQLQAHQTIWTSHLGIINFNNNVHLEPIYTSTDERVLLCKVSHVNKLLPSFTLLNIYAPATSSQRYTFYSNLLSSQYFHSIISDIHSTHVLNHNTPSIIVGDFNYNFRHFPYAKVDQYLQETPASLIIPQTHHPIPVNSTDSEETFIMPQFDSNDPSTIPPNSISQWIWHWIMTQQYTEASHGLQTDPIIPTFRRNTSLSTIDYFFLNPILASFVNSSQVQFISPEWTDHTLLSVDLRFDSPDHGSGIWRANPNLTKNTYFVEQLHMALDDFHIQLSQLSNPPDAQTTWDNIKTITKTLARRIGRSKGEWRQRQLKRLQRKRNRILRIYKDSRILHDRLPIIEQQIGRIQQDIVETLALRSGIRWRENGEKAAGVLKRLIKQQTQQRTIPSIIHPVTGNICDSPQQKQHGTQQFYQHLYTPDPINSQDTTYFTNQIPPNHRISEDKHAPLCAPFCLSDLQEGAHRSPTRSSPGPDGLPYEILTLLFQHPATGKIALQVYNNALLQSIFPSSWLETCMTLLPKKGDLSLLQNWRPISLINTDAKVFTRMINARLMQFMNKCISTNQMGFMPKRFIGEQGMIVQCLQEIATYARSDCIALLLDQQKAYDRIHFDYLKSCMRAFNIPSTIIHSITSLFSNTMIQVNVNGFLTAPFQQLRGLRQGDPLSPLLFNIAFDPLLRSIHNSTDIQGFDLQREAIPRFHNQDQQLITSFNNLNIHESTNTNTSADPPLSNFSVKIIAYADDTLVTLRTQDDFHHLQTILSKYMNASNALLNYNKTQALSLSGASHPIWQAFLQDHGITQWHDKNAPAPLIYLGYAICSNPTQRAAHAHTIISNLKKQCQIFAARSLTYRGKVTIMNSLIYSKLWHMIRLFSFSKSEIHQIQQIAAAFINNNATVTRLSFNTLTLSRKQGGLQLIDPQQQAHALQWRWLHFLLHPSQPLPTHMPSIPIIRFTLHYILGTTQYPTYHWSLLFPTCRPVIPRSYGPIVNFIRAVDTIDNSLHPCSTDITTCLQLPLFELLIKSIHSNHPQFNTFTSPTTVLLHHKTAHQLYGSDIFHFNNTTLHLEFHNSTTHLPHPTLSKQIIHLIQTNQLLLHNFVLFNFLSHVPRTIPSITNNLNIDVHLSSFLLSKISTHFIPDSFSFIASSPTTTGFKSLPSIATTPLPPLTIISASKWQQFWRLRIPINARNTWYRIIHRKITTKQRLHQFQPDIFTPYCQICRPRRYSRHAHSLTETNQHFLFSCPKKILVWTTSVVNYIDPNLAHFSFLHYSDIIKLNSSISRTNNVPFQQLSLYQVFACILQEIWVAHYRVVFDNTPFIPLTVISHIHRSLTKLHHEETLNNDI